jgi:hypothetical protein
LHDVPYLLASFAARGVSLFLEGDALRFRGPGGALDATDRDLLRDRKPAIVEYLQVRAAAARPPFGARPGEPFPPSLIQKVWVRLMSAPHAPGMEKLPLVLSYRGVDPVLAEAAIRRLFERHNALRAHFPVEGAGLSVGLNPAAALTVTVGAAADAAELETQISAVIDPPLPLHGDWLARTAVIQAAGGEVYVVLLLHHMLCDGASLSILAAEVAEHLSGAPRADHPAQYSDFARWEAAWLAGEGGATVTRYMARRMADIPLLQAPSGRRLTWLPGKKVYRALDLPAGVSRSLECAAAALKTTPFVVLVCAYARALAYWSGQDRFAIRVVGDQRTTTALSGIVGMMTVTDILDMRVPTGAGLAELVARAAAETQSAMTVRLPARPGPDGWQDGRELTGATINYLPRLPPQPLPAGIVAAVPPYLAKAAEHRRDPAEPTPAAPVFLRVIEEENGLDGRFEFNQPLVTPSEQDDMIAAFRQALETVLREALDLSGAAA